MSDHGTPRFRPSFPADRDPKRIGQWKIGRIVGEGMSGRVRIARHRKVRQYAAVKIISKATLQSRLDLAAAEAADKIVQGAEREIVVMKLIEHPHVLRLYDVWETSSELYLILEYAEGGSLFQRLEDAGSIELPRVRRYFQQIIAAVHYCHSFNICHRDLKPENILLDKDDNIKIADFGMAIWQADGASLNTACGSYHYAAPELFTGTLYDGTATDVWACGVILYSLLARKVPFDSPAGDPAELMRLIRSADYEMPSHCERDERDLIAKMLTVEPEDRITILKIRKHPFFVKDAPSDSLFEVPNLVDAYRPLEGSSGVDHDILANLRTLWPDTSEEVLVGRLLSEDPTWEQGIYHLLSEYRAKRLQDVDLADEAVLGFLDARRSKRAAVAAHALADGEAGTAPRRSPQADLLDATRRQSYDPRNTDDEGFVIVSAPPASVVRPAASVARSRPMPQPPTRAAHPSAPFVNNSSEINQRHALPANRGREGLRIDLRKSPELHTPEDKQYYGTVEQRLDEMEAELSQKSDTPVSDAHKIRLVVSPSGPPTPPNRLQDMVAQLQEETSTWNEPPSGEAIAAGLFTPPPEEGRFPGAFSPLVDGNAAQVPLPTRVKDTKPLKIQKSIKASVRRVSKRGSNKENRAGVSPRVASAATSQNRKPLRSIIDRPAVTSKEKDEIGGKRIKIVEPDNGPPSRLRKMKPPALIVTVPSPALKDTLAVPDTALSFRSGTPMSPTPSSAASPLRRWFSIPFKGKSASFELLSMRDTYTTRDECRRLLSNMGVAVDLEAVAPATPTQLPTPMTPTFGIDDGPGVLRCTLHEVHDPAEVMGALRPVRFRVDMRLTATLRTALGYVVTVVLTMEKGALSSFSLVCERLKREWELDAPLPVLALPSSRMDGRVELESGGRVGGS